LETTNFRKYASFYGLFNEEKDYAGESDYVAGLIGRYGDTGRSVLDLGCGTGRHAVELIKRGFEVKGIERSSEMAAIARENGVECEVGDISQVKLENRFDVVVSLFHVMSYLAEDEALANCFRLSYEHLEPGGLFIFDAWYSAAVLAQKPERREKTVSSGEMEIRRVAEPELDPERNIVTVHYDFSARSRETAYAETWKEAHPMRHFGLPEIQILAQNTGFQLLKAEEFLTGAPPSDHTWGVCYILKKYNTPFGVYEYSGQQALVSRK
jgi:SAM-dependent methyltransferase